MREIFKARDTDSEMDGWVKVPVLPEDKTMINVVNEKHFNYEFDCLYFGGKLYKRNISSEGIESFSEIDLQDWVFSHWQYAKDE